jgi:hypothetical protein
MTPNNSAFLGLLRHPLRFRLFLFLKLPSAFFSGVRIKAVDEGSCAVTVPYKWFSQNPFRSTYFACLAMAAEMSTGTLALIHVHKRVPAVSMLVIKLEATYFKKATGMTTFICMDGNTIWQTVLKAVETGEAQVITATSTGRNESGELVAEFFVTWSFRAKRASE